MVSDRPKPAEGKDKIVKVFEYFNKALAWHYLRTNAELSVSYFLISEKTRECRQIFRLFKWLFEIKRIQLIASSTTDRFSKVSNALSRSFYLLHFFFENAYIVAKYSNLQYAWPKFPMTRLRRMSRGFWLLGLAFFLVYCLKTLRKTYTDESDLKVAALNKMTVRQVKENLQIICKLRHDYWLNFSRALLDFLICLNENDLPFLVLGKRLSPGVEGMFGMISAVIYLYGLKRVILS